MFDLADCEAHLTGIDVRVGDDDALCDAFIEIERVRNLAEIMQARVLAELDARGVTDRDHGMRTASWAAAATGCARGPIVARLKTGRVLRHRFSTIDAALDAGTLHFDHARAVADAANPRVVDVFTSMQDEIIALADGATFEQFKRDLAALAELADTDGAEPDPYADNELRIPRTLDGNVELTGSFDAVNGSVIRQAINAKTDELFRRFSRDAEHSGDLTVPSRKTLRALALVELLREAQGAEPGAGAVPRAEVTLVVHDKETRDADGTALPQAAADVWGCDPEIWAVVVDHMGIPIDVGHTKRLATTAQRHAIAIRDGGCTFPGCDAPIDWCDHHHVVDWRHGGPTDLSNLVALCRHHHGVTHRTGWSMNLDDRQVPHWTSPTGDHLIGQRHHRRHRPPPDEDWSLPDDSPPPRAAAHGCRITPGSRPAA